ncbi:MAG: hypothetical protein FD153_1400 [Rhodospirillaceae bacterium]|nr:MAG: hypothetical protein FD153_1400 [Rhodospirillaceae bacterium]
MIEDQSSDTTGRRAMQARFTALFRRDVGKTEQIRTDESVGRRRDFYPHFIMRNLS